MARKNFKKYNSKDNDKTSYSKESSTTEPTTSGDVPDKDVKEGKTSRAINDPEWYGRDAQLLLDSASLNFSDPLGKELQLIPAGARIWGESPVTEQGLYMSEDAAERERAVPGICTLYMKHTIGTSFNRNSPANVAANAFYTHVRYVNSGRKNYDPADLMIYAFTIGDLQAFIHWVKRLYAYAFLYSQRNQYIGKALLEANNVDADDVILNLANLRYWLNTFINKVASFVLPSDIPYFSRRKFMYDGLYLENPYDNLKDQLYQYAPEGFYKFALDEGGKGSLVWTGLTRKFDVMQAKWTFVGPLTVNKIIQYGTDLISNIMGDEDFGLMSGDILKAYGNEGILGLESLPEDYYVVPHYDMTVLSQFKNATINDAARRSTTAFKYKSPADADTVGYVYKSGDIMQDNKGNIVCYEGVVPNNNNPYEATSIMTRKVISLEIPVPGPADNIEATRDMLVGGNPNTTYTENETIPFVSGVDFPVACVFTTSIGGSTSTYIISSNVVEDGLSAIEDQAFEVSQMFKYAPIMYQIQTASAGVGKYVEALFVASNVDNYTVIDGRVLEKMHECALLSLFFVPGVAKLINYLK